MGCAYARPETDLMVYVQTADRQNAGTDATITIVLYDTDDNSSEAIDLDNYFRDDFERASLDAFRVPARKTRRLNKRTADIARVEFWKDDRWLGGDWCVDTIEVKNNVTSKSFLFPVYRWVKTGFHYQIKHLGTSLPQFDEFPEQREMELSRKRAAYQYQVRFQNGPVKIKELPPEEQYPFDFKWDFGSLRATLTAASMLGKTLASGRWENFNDMKNIFKESTFSRPSCINDWADDVRFGLQRVQGFNYSVITRATSIPDKFPVTDKMLGTLLESLTLQEAIDQKRLFICDLEILEGCPVKDNFVLCHPIAMFFLDSDDKLRPVAIQLFQKPCPDNPIFTPLDSKHLWTLVKMWYNNADAAHHLAVTRFGLTQCLMEGFAIAAHRNLSPTHPIFKLLTPHFLYLIAINSKTLDFLISKDEWLDRNLNTGRQGFVELLVKGYKSWRMGENGHLPTDLRRRGLEDPSILPCYHFRDDAALLYDVIMDYIESYVHLYYENEVQILADSELQSWCQELAEDISDGGVGIRGLPWQGQVTSFKQLTQLLTCLIYTCSVAHAAASLPQYEGYGFPPNYPSSLTGTPPTSKEASITEKDLLDILPDKPNTLETMVFNKLFSTKGTNRLGDFEVDFIFDPQAKAIVKQFQKRLREASQEIKTRNRSRSYPYLYLDPEIIPNNISI